FPTRTLYRLLGRYRTVKVTSKVQYLIRHFIAEIIHNDLLAFPVKMYKGIVYDEWKLIVAPECLYQAQSDADVQHFLGGLGKLQRVEQLSVAVWYFDAAFIVYHIDVSSARHAFKNGPCLLYDDRQAFIFHCFDLVLNQYAYIVQGYILVGETLDLVFSHFKHMVEFAQLPVTFEGGDFRVDFRKHLLLVLDLFVEFFDLN